jgi:long-subunit fatty acid transport protein
VGVSYEAPVGRHAVALRVGYLWDPSPTPMQSGVTTLIDADRHVFSLGLGATFRRLGAAFSGALSVDAFASLQLLGERATRKADPTDATGDFVASGYVLATGINVALGFE